MARICVNLALGTAQFAVDMSCMSTILLLEPTYEKEKNMGVTRREFLFASGTIGAGLALATLGVDMRPVVAYAEELSKIDRVKSAKQTYIHLLLLFGSTAV